MYIDNDVEKQADIEYYQEHRIENISTWNDPMNAFRVPGVPYDRNVKTFVIDGRTVYCSFGRTTVCGE